MSTLARNKLLGHMLYLDAKLSKNDAVDDMLLEKSLVLPVALALVPGA